MPGAPPSAGTTSPESSASAGMPLGAAAARALSSALASKVAPVSSGSGNPSAAAPSTAMPKGDSSSAISTSFPLLWVATTSRSPANRRATALDRRQRRALHEDEARDPAARQRQHAAEALLGEGLGLG